MESLDRLEQNVSRLLSAYQQLKDENARLARQNQELDDRIYEYRKQLDELRTQFRRLELARALSETDGNKQNARRLVDGLITRVDRALETLRG